MTDCQELVRVCDELLYAAKAPGRDTVRSATLDLEPLTGSKG